MHYFFSLDDKIQKFMDETLLEIRITRGKDWTNALAKGDG